MADVANLKVVILWEDELRTAAKALAAVHAASDDDYSKAAIQALNACMVALHGVVDDSVLAMIGASELHLKARKKAAKGTAK